MSFISSFIIIYWIILIVSYLMCSFYFFILRYKSGEDEIRSRITTIVCFIFLFIALSRLIHLLVIFRHGGFFHDDLSVENELLFMVSQILFYSGVITIIFSFERSTKKFEKPYFTILNSIIASLYFIFHGLHILNKSNITLFLIENIISYLLNSIIGILGLVLALTYLRISIKTSGEVMKKAFLVFIGFILLIISYSVFIFEEFLISQNLIAIISFTVGLCGIPFLIFGYK
ncbi:MAG: hypothetical protein ACTSQJ_06845 [Promethearchaeota archaeon]